jgi:hypothetical protein
LRPPWTHKFAAGRMDFAVRETDFEAQSVGTTSAIESAN